MATRRDGWLNQNGLNLLRIVVGAHVCAVAMGVIDGFDPALPFAMLMPSDAAVNFGVGVLLTLSLGFMLGLYLRATALLLATLILCSSVAGAIGTEPAQALSRIWQDVTLICALILSYGGMRPHDMHKAALMSPALWRGRGVRWISKEVKPRRVTPGSGRSRAERADTVLRPLIAPTERMTLPERSKRPTVYRTAGFDDEDEVNIFADI